MSRRHEYRRAASEDPSKPLTATEIVRLNAQRTLPPGHPSSTKDYPIQAPLDMSSHAIDVLERSGVLPYLERRLRGHPGKKSELPLLALLVRIGSFIAFSKLTSRQKKLTRSQQSLSTALSS